MRRWPPTSPGRSIRCICSSKHVAARPAHEFNSPPDPGSNAIKLLLAEPFVRRGFLPGVGLTEEVQVEERVLDSPVKKKGTGTAGSPSGAAEEANCSGASPLFHIPGRSINAFFLMFFLLAWWVHRSLRRLNEPRGYGSDG